MARQIIDMTGQTYGDLKVLRQEGRDSRGKPMWLCECLNCGKQRSLSGYSLRVGDTKSCGCRRGKNKQKKHRRIEYDGKTLSLTKLAMELGIPHDTLYGRLRRGWTVEDAMRIPVRQNKQNARQVEDPDVISPESV